MLHISSLQVFSIPCISTVDTGLNNKALKASSGDHVSELQTSKLNSAVFHSPLMSILLQYY